MEQMHSLTVVNWNVEWVTPRSRRFRSVRDLIVGHNPDVVCITEGEQSVMPDDGHTIESDPDYGYSTAPPHRRKVLLWSRRRWTLVDTLGSSGLPGGRFVVGTTETPIGAVRFVGVCIPWRDAHVRTGRADRSPWEDHLLYLSSLDEVLSGLTDSMPTVIVGDFNQTVPKTWAPQRVFDALMHTFRHHDVITAGALPGTTRPAIDHLAVTHDLTVASIRGWSNIAENGERLSDHDGVVAELRLTEDRQTQ